MKLFFDFEFTGLHQNTTPISLGIISEDGRYFYAEFNDYDRSQLDDWIKENVIKNLKFKTPQPGEDEYYSMNRVRKDISLSEKWTVRMRGNTEAIRKELTKWLSQFKDIEMWSDCLAYDWVLFNNIFGTAFDIPENVYYIPFDICTLFKVKNIDPDINREKFVMSYSLEIENDNLYKELKNESEKHYALWDALIIKWCYEGLMKIQDRR